MRRLSARSVQKEAVMVEIKAETILPREISITTGAVVYQPGLVIKEFKMRDVKVYKYEKLKDDIHYTKLFDYGGTFHQFGYDYEEFEAGPGNFSTAIIELPDGTIKNVPVEMVRFV